jgi:hypothetical protein
LKTVPEVVENLGIRFTAFAAWNSTFAGLLMRLVASIVPLDFKILSPVNPTVTLFIGGHDFSNVPSMIKSSIEKLALFIFPKLVTLISMVTTPIKHKRVH